MKIKEVCEKTALTSRTVRLYIEEELISPEYTQNYLGRKSFKFCEDDVENLLDIAALRKAGFSISQIKEIQTTKENSSVIILDIVNKKRNQIEENKIIIEALESLDYDKSYTVKEIAEVLRISADRVEFVQEKEDILGLVLKWAKIALSTYICIYPVAKGIEMLFYAVDHYASLLTCEDIISAIMAWVCMLLPSLIFVISILVKKVRKIKNFTVTHNAIVLSLLLVFYITIYPFFTIATGFSINYIAETKSISDYMMMTHDQENQSFPYIFPEKVPDSAFEQGDDKKPEYYYTNYFEWSGETYEMFAEWYLPENEFKAELERVNSFDNEEYTYGDFTVKVFEFSEGRQEKNCLAFAYNDEVNNVRYIYYGGCIQESYFCDMKMDELILANYS